MKILSTYYWITKFTWNQNIPFLSFYSVIRVIQESEEKQSTNSIWLLPLFYERLLHLVQDHVKKCHDGCPMLKLLQMNLYLSTPQDFEGGVEAFVQGFKAP